MSEARVQARLQALKAKQMKAIHEKELLQEQQAESEARLRAEEARRLEEEARRLEEDARHRAEEAKRREIDAQNDAKRQAYEAQAALRRKQLQQDIELAQQLHKMEELNAEVELRQREEVRLDMGSDYESDDEREDVTKLNTDKTPTHAPNND